MKYRNGDFYSKFCKFYIYKLFGGGKMKLNHMKFDLEKLIVVFFTDLHFGSKYHDKELFLENRDWVLETPNVYVIEGGDLMETATKDSVGAGVFEQSDIVQEQLEKTVELYKPIADEGRLIGMHRGNHEYRVFKHSGLDLTKTAAKMLNTKYFGDGVIHYFNVGDQNYTLYSAHGHSGARLPHTKIKACIDYANMVDVEIYLMGHLHQLSHH